MGLLQVRGTFAQRPSGSSETRHFMYGCGGDICKPLKNVVACYPIEGIDAVSFEKSFGMEGWFLQATEDMWHRDQLERLCCMLQCLGANGEVALRQEVGFCRCEMLLGIR